MMTNLKMVILPLMIVIIVLLALVAWQNKNARSMTKVRCSDFKTQIDAQLAYKQGAIWLDGYDRDKQACEHLPVK